MKARKSLYLAEKLSKQLKPTGMGPLAQQHLEWCLIRNYSEQTVLGKLRGLRNFISWCEERGVAEVHEVLPAHLDRYQKYLYQCRRKNGEAVSFAGQSQQLSHLKLFFSWCVKKRLLQYNPASEVELPRSEKRLPRYVLTQNEAERVLGAVDLKEEDGTGLRDRAVLEVLYSTGIRRLELTNLKIFDLDFERGIIMVRLGKGKRDRVIPIGSRAMYWVKKYLSEARPLHVVEPDPKNIFLTVQGQQIHEDYLSDIVRRYVEGSGISKKGSCHLFRHTMATLLLENGADLRAIQAMLGHANTKATEVYTHVGIKRLKDIHEALHPGAKLERRTEAPEDLD